MGAAELIIAPDSLFHWDGRRMITYRSDDVMPIASPIPATLLLDSDAMFAYKFEKFARHYDVPVRAFESVTSLQDNLQWDYDLVLLDQETVGEEFVAEVAADITASYGSIPIMVIGRHDPSSWDMKAWGSAIQGFSNKDWGIEAVFNEALQIFATAKRNARPKLLA